MKKLILTLIVLAGLQVLIFAQTGIDVNRSYFLENGENITITTVECTLSDSTETSCYQINTNSTPSDHQMGPWCPTNIADDSTAGGIWLESGEVYHVDGAFVENLATFYNDSTWLMYDANGDIFVTLTEEDCINAANPNVGDAYQNFCVECLPAYIAENVQSWVIPITPVMLDEPVSYDTGGGRPPGGPGAVTIPSTRGIALNGVEFSAPAPVNNILGAYTIAPFDDAGGHINVNQGYHYHAATGMSSSIEQSDGHAPLIGYAMDGHAIYARLDANGEEPTDLDECRGHIDDIRGYHYHIDAAGNNNFINCLAGAFVVETGDEITATHEIGNTLLNIYPNPATDLINIDVQGLLAFEASLYNINGQLLTTTNTNQLVLDPFPSGMYILQIIDQQTNDKIVEKILIEK